jgi:diadenosine tetraphosphate (Ap4A) HIT family hydrolase
MPPFELHPNLASKRLIARLPLCCVLLEDELHYPWIVLVPQRNHVSRIMDLSIKDQQQLLIELDLAQKILWTHFQPAQINVAAIGNKTPQLHVHVIARFANDPAWPHTVWDHPARSPYPAEHKEQVTTLLSDAFTGGA